MQNKTFEGANENLAEILQGREDRAARQAELLHKFSGCTVVCFTLNIAGPNKRSALIDKAFEIGISQLEKRLRLNEINIEYFEKASPQSGNEAYFIMHKNAKQIKEIACALEEDHPLGRLFDIDIICEGGEKILRGELALPPRKCIICENPAAECARSREHGINAVITKTNCIMQEYFNNEFAERITEIALKALLNEVCITPKPGLVDCANSGAHSDMNIFSFMNSAAAISAYFRKTARFGIRFNGKAEDILKHIKPLGIDAEEQMLAATNGVNTHLGAIYSLGILCTACGYLYGNDMPLSADNASAISAIIAQSEGDFGARAEAKSGFKSAGDFALPRLMQSLKSGYSWNISCGFALLDLMANIEDTNIIARGGKDKARIMRQKAQETLEKASKMREGEALILIKELDDEYIAQNLSPGGAADLLAIAIFFYLLEAQQRGAEAPNL